MRQFFNMAMARSLCGAAHGSGLDTEPSIEQSKRSIVVDWAFHLMDDQGFYCGYWRFALTIPKSDPMEFRLTGRRGNPRGAAAFRMKEYLEERFADAVAETLAGGGATALWLGGEWRYDGGVEADE